MARSTTGPALKFERRQKKKLGIKELDAEVVEMVEQYPAYYKESTGEDAPTVEEVIEQAIRKALGSDAGFKKFREGRRSGGGAAGSGSGGK
jgi:hypothetical protein